MLARSVLSLPAVAVFHYVPMAVLPLNLALGFAATAPLTIEAA